jgi:hypothetical protein
VATLITVAAKLAKTMTKLQGNTQFWQRIFLNNPKDERPQDERIDMARLHKRLTGVTIRPCVSNVQYNNPDYKGVRRLENNKALAP